MSKRQPPRLLSRSQGWTCLISNLVLPGSGSLIAGRRIGYFQIVIALVGLGFSLVETIGVISWYLQNYKRLNNADDPFAALAELGHALLKPAVGFGIFAIAIVWAMVTSWSIIRGTVKS